jgi:thymidylate kinase
MSSDIDNPVIVEFFGLPASGKSTLCKGLENRLAKEGIPTSNITLKIINQKGTYEGYIFMIGYAILTMIRCPRISLRLLQLIHDTNQRCLKDIIRLWLYSLFVHTSFRKCKNKEGIHHFDQGVYQLLWSIALTADSIDKSILQSILSEFPTPKNHIIVFVDIDVEVSMERLAARDGNFSRVETLLENEVVDGSSLCIEAHQLVHKLIKESDKSKPLLIIHVNTASKTVKSTIEKIYFQIYPR